MTRLYRGPIDWKGAKSSNMHEWVGNDKMLLSDITQCLEKGKREKDFKNLGKIVIICQSIHIFRNTWCFINSPISSTTFYTIWKLLQKVSFYNFEVSILASHNKSSSTILRGCIPWCWKSKWDIFEDFQTLWPSELFL